MRPPCPLLIFFSLPSPIPVFLAKGFVQAGKLRRSRPVLPPDSEMRALPSSPRHRENVGDALPPGCTIVNRYNGFGDANTNSKPLITTQRHSVGDKRAGDGLPLATPRPNTSKPALAFAEAVIVSAAPLVTIAPEDVAGEIEATAVPVRLEAPTAEMENNPAEIEKNPVEIENPRTKMGIFPGEIMEAVRHEEMSSPRQEGGAATITTTTTSTTTVTQPSPPPPPRLGDAGTAGGKTRVLYNPGPTFRRPRGRKRKTLLDASRVTADDIIGAEKVLALVADPIIQQASLVVGYNSIGPPTRSTYYGGP